MRVSVMRARDTYPTGGRDSARVVVDVFVSAHKREVSRSTLGWEESSRRFLGKFSEISSRKFLGFQAMDEDKG